MNLALLLLGPAALHRSRHLLLAAGLAAVALGVLVAVDGHETVTLVALEGAGWFAVALGLARVALALVTAEGRLTTAAAPGAALVLLGLALADFTSEANGAAPWFLGLALVVEGGYRAASAAVIRFPGWGGPLAAGLGLVAGGVFLLLERREALEWLVPLVVGATIAGAGLYALLFTARLGRYLPGASGGPAGAVRYLLDFHVPRRFRRYLAADALDAPGAGPATAPGELRVHVWTPATVARVAPHRDPVSRYVAARDAEGKFTVGHAALELAPDVYVSHCDGDPTAFDSQAQVWETLRSRDVAGVFLPSFEEEIATYPRPTATLAFRRFDGAQLRAFWAIYRAVTTYNFTNRNCSVAVALALEAALVGQLAGRGRLRDLAQLATRRELWAATLLREKAREMVWTPGLVLDYARALHALLEAQ